MTIYSSTFPKLKMFEAALEMASARGLKCQTKAILLSSGLLRFASPLALGFPSPHNALSLAFPWIDAGHPCCLSFEHPPRFDPTLHTSRLIFLKHGSSQTPSLIPNLLCFLPFPTE